MIAALAQNFDRLVSFRGRASRVEFWAIVAAAFLAMLPAFLTEFRWLFWTTHDYTVLVTQTSYVTGETSRVSQQVTEAYFTLFSVRGGWLTIVPLCLVALPLLSVLVRRLHDLGRPGWWAALAFFLIFALEPLLRVTVEFLAFSVPILALIMSVLLGFPTFILSCGALIVLALWTANEGEPTANEYGPTPMGIFK